MLYCLSSFVDPVRDSFQDTLRLRPTIDLTDIILCLLKFVSQRWRCNVDATGPRLDTTPKKAIAELESRLCMKEPDVALALGISQRSLHRWSSGESHPQRASRTNLARLVALSEHLQEAFGEDADE